MKITKALLLLCSLFLFGTNTQAQQRCNMNAHMQELLSNPDFARNYEKQQKKFNKYNDENPTRALCANPVVLPMAVHFQNLSNPDAACLIDQALNQIQILNDDYQGLNADITNWTNGSASTFPGISNGETCIEFCLATTGHPSGFGLNDGDYAVTVNAFNGDNNAAWAGYINIFVRANTGVLGYSPLGGSGNGDGVVIDANAFGSGSGCPGVVPGAPYNLGRTLTHELGHYLNLDHIWGNGCNGDDGVSDTPDQQSENYGCPNVGITSCNTADMHMNYMDYTNDACMYMFSAGQSTRMENYTNNNLQNVIAKGQTVCGPPADPTCDDGIQNQGEEGVDCGGPCTAICPTCTDGVQNGDEEGVDCGGSNCAPCPCNGTNVRVTITFDNYPEETSWSIVDASGATVESGGTYANEPDGSTLTIDACLADGCYDFIINDSYGDGICCGYGNGSYSVTNIDDGGAVLASGSEFTTSETTNFCVQGTSDVPGCTNPDAHNYNPNATVDDGSCKTCTDGILNGDETDVDCGGALCAACPTVTCDAPVATATVISGGCVKLDWPAMAGATEYRCRYRPVGGTWIQYNASFDLSFLNDLTIGGSYEFQVKTKCGSTNSVWSNTVAFTTASDNCDRPNTVTLSNVTATGCDVSWSQDPDDLKYKVGYKLVSGSTWTQVFVSLPNTSYTISGLASGADYKVRVKTKCSGGWTNWTAKEDLTTLASAVSNSAREGNFVANVYPNPVNQTLNIDYNLEADGKVSIQVFDILGKAVIATEANQAAGANTAQLDVSELTNGNHYVRIQSGNQQIVKKFVKF